MTRRGRSTLVRRMPAIAGAIVLLSPAAAMAVGVETGGVGLPGGANVPGVSVDVPAVPGPTVNVPQVQVPDPAGTVNQVSPTVGGLLGGGSTGGGSSSGSDPPSTPSTPSTPSGGDPSGGTTPTTPPPADPGNAPSGQKSGNGNGQRNAGGSNASAGTGQAGGVTAAATPAKGTGGGNAKPKDQAANPTISSRIADVISALPSGILIGLIGLAVLGLLMTGRSAWFIRASRRLTLVRRSLEEDVGVLQAALVPDLPEKVGGVGVAVAYLPATGPAAGGDFHDVFEIDRDTIGIVVGDVAGHGREALPRTGVVRYTIRAYLEAGLEPRLALRLADRALRADLAGDEEFATAIAATYDRRTSRLVYSCAGHPHPIVLGVDVPEPVEALGSPPIGVSGASGCRQTMLALGSEAELWFFSDGLIEGHERSEDMMGRDGLRELLELHPEPEVLLEEVPSSDDLTLCRLRPPAPEDVEAFSVETLLIETDYDLNQVSRFLSACGMGGQETGQALERIAAESKYEGEILVRVSRLGSVQHCRIERILPELGGTPEGDPSTQTQTAA
jgi:hypothetical protein